MGNSPSTGHGGEEDHVIRDMDGRNSGERPTEEQSKMSTKTKSDSYETPIPKPPHSLHFAFRIPELNYIIYHVYFLYFISATSTLNRTAGSQIRIYHISIHGDPTNQLLLLGPAHPPFSAP